MKKKTPFSVGIENIDSFINDAINKTLSGNQLVNALAVSAYSRDLTGSLSYLQNNFMIKIKKSNEQSIRHKKFHNFEPDLISTVYHSTIKNIVLQVEDKDLNEKEKIPLEVFLCANMNNKSIIIQTIEMNHKRALNLLKRYEMSPEQDKVIMFALNLMKEMVELNKKPFSVNDPPILLVTGGPGTGKSFCINIITQLGDIMEINLRRVCFMGVAAVNINGSTIQKFFQIGAITDNAYHITPLNEQKLQNLRLSLGINDKNMSAMILIDEISTVKPSLLSAMDSRLRQVTGNKDIKFGGICVLMFGDFAQLPPPKAQTLADAAIMFTIKDVSIERINNNKILPVEDQLQILKKHKNEKEDTKGKYHLQSNYRKGFELIKDIFWIKLTIQQRSKTDLDHTKLIDELGCGLPITLDKLKRYQFLCANGMKDKTWRYAPVLVTTNRERIDVIHQQAIMFAIEHNTHVIRWPVFYSDWSNRPKKYQETIVNDPVFWQYYVDGAELFITANLNTDIGIANGTKGTCHSITLINDMETKYLRNEIKSKPIGSIISLSRIPLSINIEMYKGEIKRIKNWKRKSLMNNKVVIALIHDKKHCNTKKK